MKKEHDRPMEKSFIEGRNEPRKSDELLAGSQEFLKRLIESSFDCIKVLDLDGNLLSMSAGGLKILEIEDFSPYLNTSWVEFWNIEDRDPAIEAISKAKKGDMGKFSGSTKTVNGTPKWFESIITPIKNDKGEFETLLAISRDITESKQAEIELSIYHNQMEELVQERTAKLEETNADLIRFQEATIDREFRMKELKDEIKYLKSKLIEN